MLDDVVDGDRPDWTAGKQRVSRLDQRGPDAARFFRPISARRIGSISAKEGDFSHVQQKANMTIVSRVVSTGTVIGIPGSCPGGVRNDAQRPLCRRKIRAEADAVLREIGLAHLLSAHDPPDGDAELAGLVGEVVLDTVAGKTMVPIGRVSSMASFRLKGAAFACCVQSGRNAI